MKKIKIEKNVPIPPKQGRVYKYPWADMEVNDSFFVECGETKKEIQSKMYNLINSAKGFAKRQKNNPEFTVRRMDKGVRIWRIK